MSTTATPIDAARDALGEFSGDLIGPDDGTYDESRALFNAMIDKRPALIARPRTAGEIATVIRFARDQGLALAIRGGGHNGGGLGSVDAGVLCDLSLLKSITVDPEKRTATVGGGALWGEVDAATAPHGMYVPAGIISTTGVAGLTLGGGHGYLTRRHGLTIDNLLSAEVVLADGTTVTASPDEHPDLFWAIRGGGGNFGVVTEFTFQAQPVDTIVGGPVFWALEDTDELLAAYREWLPSAPRNVMGFFNFHTIPPGPPFPEEIHMRKVCGVVYCIDGTDEEAATAMAPLLEIAEPLMNGTGRMPLKDLNSAFDALYGPGDQWYWRGAFTSEIPDEAIERNREWNDRMPSWKSGSHVYPIDGAAHDVAADDTAFAYRNSTWSQVFIGVDADPGLAGTLRDWTVGYWEALHPYSDGGAYVNFMMEEGQARVKSTYGPNYDRLATIKAEYDPDNVFRVNQNILPAT